MAEIRHPPVDIFVGFPIIDRVLYIPGGAGFQPSTVVGKHLSKLPYSCMKFDPLKMDTLMILCRKLIPEIMTQT